MNHRPILNKWKNKQVYTWLKHSKSPEVLQPFLFLFVVTLIRFWLKWKLHYIVMNIFHTFSLSSSFYWKRQNNEKKQSYRYPWENFHVLNISWSSPIWKLMLVGNWSFPLINRVRYTHRGKCVIKITFWMFEWQRYHLANLSNKYAKKWNSLLPIF